jgi:hypothetical protein
MKALSKWLLASAALAAGLSLAWAEQAEAARWGVHVYYPGYAPLYVQRYWPAPYYYPAYYGWAPPVRVQVYRPAPVVVPYVAAPIVAPAPMPVYPVYPAYPVYPMW